MKINNSEYGGFVVSKNILAGKPVRYSFRQESSIPQLNGWNLYAIDDIDEYVNHADNFIILNAESIFKIAPVMFEIFEAPYGTDLCWLYEEGIHIGFYDVVADKEVTINELIKQN
ncbi:DUF2185 domain-containing protein [Bacillus pseudomycoides]|uniref:DUF2185 domain-containing protein n=1 Tax=Bacillus pseudomycoides TaxID=64104 RepID=UPI000BEF73DF|nr:DUF2185 domain-containing protein [Bacillus pseudomycoides]PEJ35596.1 hypothetical protein CN677_13390 [Bacillus pseudomycoides]PHA69765.1 hypothetical protein COE78_30640 [Bacillus pseudomycoides]PHB17990.1 hypothetical protein COE80_26145 [Bacillus pseudomycoides]PHC78722.1 hypothetical protein COF38_05055 [Bacillus pseudomycoides]